MADEASDDILDGFLAEVAAPTSKRAPKRAPSAEAPEGSLAEAEAEGYKLTAKELRRAKALANRPIVQSVGVGPVPDPRPRCRLCGDHRRLSEALIRLPDGSEGRLCPTCVKQVEYDREKRCVSCGTPQEAWLPGGVCAECQRKGTERVQNIRRLKGARWIGITGAIVP